MTKIVLDPSVWMKFFLNQEETKLAKMIVEHQLCIYYNNKLLDEIERLCDCSMANKYQLNTIHAIRFIKLGAAYFFTKEQGVYYVPTDKGDNYIVSLASQTKSILVSNDEHIIEAKSELTTAYKQRLMTVEEFEQQFNLDNTTIF